MSEKIGKFVVLKHLGSGAFGDVVAVKDPSNGNIYAVKSIFSKTGVSEVLKEFEVMLNKDFVNPFLLRYYCLSSEGEMTRIFMEYCENGDLDEYVQKKISNLSENEILDIFAQVVKGVSVLHDKNIIHRDLKGKNILLNKKKEVKLADFGASKIISGSTTMIRGTHGFIPAEVISGEVQSTASDIFALGCTMYFVTTKRLPFDGANAFKTQSLVMEGKYAPIERTDISAGVKKLIYQMLDTDPAKRPSAAQLLGDPALFARVSSLPPREPVPPAPVLLGGFSASGATNSSVTVTGTPNTRDESAAGVDPDVAEFIEMAVEENPTLATADFRGEFEESLGRKPSVAEINVFLKVKKRKNPASAVAFRAAPFASAAVTVSLPAMTTQADPRMAYLQDMQRKSGTLEVCMKLVKEKNTLKELMDMLGGLSEEDIKDTRLSGVFNTALDLAIKLFYNICNRFVPDGTRKELLKKADGKAELRRLFNLTGENIQREKVAVVIAKTHYGRLLGQEDEDIIPVLVNGLSVCERSNMVHINSLVVSFVDLTYLVEEEDESKHRKLCSLLISNGVLQVVSRFFTCDDLKIVREASAVFNNLFLRCPAEGVQTGVLSSVAAAIASLSSSSFVLAPSPLDLLSVSRPTSVSHSMAVEFFSRGLNYSLNGADYGEICRGIVSAGLIPVLAKTLPRAYTHSSLVRGEPAAGDMEKSTERMMGNVIRVLWKVCKVEKGVFMDTVLTSFRLVDIKAILNKCSIIIQANRNNDSTNNLLENVVLFCYYVCYCGENNPSSAGRNGHHDLFMKDDALDALVGIADVLYGLPSATLDTNSTLANTLNLSVVSVLFLLKGVQPTPAKKLKSVLRYAKSKVDKSEDKDRLFYALKYVENLDKALQDSV